MSMAGIISLRAVPSSFGGGEMRKSVGYGPEEFLIGDSLAHL